MHIVEEQIVQFGETNSTGHTQDQWIDVDSLQYIRVFSAFERIFCISIFDFNLIKKFFQLPESIHAICCYLTRYYCLNKFIEPCAFTSFELFTLYVCFVHYLHISCNVCKYFISEIELGIQSTRIKTVYLTIACLKRICLF